MLSHAKELLHTVYAIAREKERLEPPAFCMRLHTHTHSGYTHTHSRSGYILYEKERLEPPAFRPCSPSVLATA